MHLNKFVQQLQERTKIVKGIRVLLKWRKFQLVKQQSFMVLKIKKTIYDGLLVLLWYRHQERAQKPVLNPWSFTIFKTNIHKYPIKHSWCFVFRSNRLNSRSIVHLWRDGKGGKGSFTRLLATSPRRGLGRTMLPKYSTLSRIGMLMHVGSRVTSLPGTLFQNVSPVVHEAPVCGAYSSL